MGVSGGVSYGVGRSILRRVVGTSQITMVVGGWYRSPGLELVRALGARVPGVVALCGSANSVSGVSLPTSGVTAIELGTNIGLDDPAVCAAGLAAAGKSAGAAGSYVHAWFPDGVRTSRPLETLSD